VTGVQTCALPICWLSCLDKYKTTRNMVEVRHMGFEREIAGGWGFTYGFVTNEKIPEDKLEEIKKAIETICNKND